MTTEHSLESAELAPKRRKMESAAEELESRVESLRGQLGHLVDFDPKQFVNVHSDELMIQVSEAVDQAVRQLRDLEEDLLREIKEGRERGLGGLRPDVRRGEQVEALAAKVEAFGRRWGGPAAAGASDESVRAALARAKSLEARMGALAGQMKRDAFQGQLMVLEAPQPLLDESIRSRLRLVVQEAPLTSRELRIQETPSRTLLAHTDLINQVLFLPDGRLASCSHDKSIKVWTVPDGALAFELRGHTKWVNTLVTLADGRLASGSRDATVRVWDLNERCEVRTLRGHTNSVVSLRLLKEAARLASYACDDTIRIWSVAADSESLLMTIRGHGNTCWLIPFGVLSNDDLVTCSRDKDFKEECIVRVWSASSGQVTRTMATGLCSVRSMLVLNDDQVALGFVNGAIKLVDPRGRVGSRTKPRAHAQSVASLVQLSNGLLLSCGFDGAFTLKLWLLPELDLLQSVAAGHERYIESLGVSPDERLLATASRDRTIKFWPLVYRRQF